MHTGRSEGGEEDGKAGREGGEPQSQPSVMFPPERFHLLKVSYSSKCLNVSPWGHLSFKPPQVHCTFWIPPVSLFPVTVIEYLWWGTL